MNKVNLGYYTLEEAAKKWDRKVFDIVEWGAHGLLKIWETSSLRQKRTAKPLSTQQVNEILNKYNLDEFELAVLEEVSEYSPQKFYYRSGINYAIKDKEFHQFTQKQNFKIHIEGDYPLELQVAIEVWQKVLGYGIKTSSLNKSKSKAVKDALRPYNLKKTAVLDRIADVVVADKSGKILTETTTTIHSRNEPDHPDYSKSLEIAVDIWKRIKGGSKLKDHANVILESVHSTLGINQKKLIRLMVAPG